MSKAPGRNDPCFCGSGKKYKKCCIGREISTDGLPDKVDLLPPRKEIDYGPPRLDEEFFDRNALVEISAARLTYFRMIQPDLVENCAAPLRLESGRHVAEADEISRVSGAEELFGIIRRGFDPLNDALVRKKFLEYKEALSRFIIKELKVSKDDNFIETGVVLLLSSGMNFAEEVMDIVEHHRKDAYSVATLCLLLGFFDHPKIPKLLWDYFHFFKTHFPRDTYCEGPLLGLCEIDRRNQVRPLTAPVVKKYDPFFMADELDDMSVEKSSGN